MKAIILAVYFMNGIGKTNGRSYDMRQVDFLSPFESFTISNEETKQIQTNRQGSGFQVSNLPVDPTFFPKLKAFFDNEFALKSQPILIDFETTIRSRGRSSETIISDFSDSFKSKYPQLKQQSESVN